MPECLLKLSQLNKIKHFILPSRGGIQLSTRQCECSKLKYGKVVFPAGLYSSHCLCPASIFPPPRAIPTRKQPSFSSPPNSKQTERWKRDILLNRLTKTINSKLLAARQPNENHVSVYDALKRYYFHLDRSSISLDILILKSHSSLWL